MIPHTRTRNSTENSHSLLSSEEEAIFSNISQEKRDSFNTFMLVALSALDKMISKTFQTLFQDKKLYIKFFFVLIRFVVSHFYKIAGHTAGTWFKGICNLQQPPLLDYVNTEKGTLYSNVNSVLRNRAYLDLLLSIWFDAYLQFLSYFYFWSCKKSLKKQQ